MKRVLIIVGLLFGLATGVAQAQTRVGVSLSFGDPHFAGQVVIGRPYYRPYYYRYHRFYHPVPLIIVREPRVVVVRPHRYYARRHHRHW
jgi:hypothetical protein